MNTPVLRSFAVAGLMLMLVAALTAQSNLPQLAQAAYDKHSYIDGGALFLMSAQADPNGAAGHLYNAACCYALGGQKDLAIYALGLAAGKGWRNVQHTESDEDLTSLRTDPRWKEILGAMASGSQSQDNRNAPGMGTPGVPEQSNRDAIINDLNNLSAMAYQYRIRPNSMGGGEGSYTGFKIPARMTSNKNAAYETVLVEADRVRIRATSAAGYGTVESSIDKDGRLGDWAYTARFAEPLRERTGVSNRDAIINDLNNLAAQAYQYRIRPSSMGGGQGSYAGFKIPARMASNGNGTYETLIVEPNLVRFRATSGAVNGTVESSIDRDGRLSDWKYSGAFAESPKSKEVTSPITANRDALINQMNNIAAYCYQYRIRPTSMGGGQGAYAGVKLPEKLATSEDGTFSLTEIDANALKIEAISKKVKGSITTMLDANGRMGYWTYYGELQ